MTKKTVMLGLALVAGWMASGATQAATESMTKAGCTACHAQDKKMVGPSFKDIAAKYKGQADAAAALTQKVRAGGKGVWGPIPMPPNPAAKISDADLAASIAWILQQ